MSDEYKNSRLVNYFLRELSILFYIMGVPMCDAVREFRTAYVNYAVLKSDSQSAAAQFLQCHRNTVNREFKKGLGPGDSNR